MKLVYKIGNGIDHHELIKSPGYITLANKTFKSDYVVRAHSDGDVILHSISNAILNALGLDDIGTYFSDSDPKNKNLNSLEILNFSLYWMRKSFYQINNISIILESDKIFLKPIKAEILQNLKKILGTEEVSIHGIRSEQNLNKISVYATILITNLR